MCLAGTAIPPSAEYQRGLAQAQSAEVAAPGVYAKAKSALGRSVGLTLKNNNVSIDEACDGKLFRPAGYQIALS
jgi:hypothetical protein